MTVNIFHLKTHVPESRQIVLTLPADCPVGDADLEVVLRPSEQSMPREEEIVLSEPSTALVHPRPTHPKLALEHDAFLCLLPVLLKQHRGRYVALHEGAIVAMGDTEIATLNLAHDQQPAALVLVRKVTDQPEPIERLPSFRPADGV